MNFTKERNIYVQITTLIYGFILSEEWKLCERIPSIRELSIKLKVTPNTVMRTYRILEQMKIISLSRGKGFFLTDKAYNNVSLIVKEDLYKFQLPILFKRLALFKISPQELCHMYKKYLDQKT